MDDTTSPDRESLQCASSVLSSLQARWAAADDRSAASRRCSLRRTASLESANWRLVESNAWLSANTWACSVATSSPRSVTMAADASHPSVPLGVAYHDGGATGPEPAPVVASCGAAIRGGARLAAGSRGVRKSVTCNGGCITGTAAGDAQLLGIAAAENGVGAGATGSCGGCGGCAGTDDDRAADVGPPTTPAFGPALRTGVDDENLWGWCGCRGCCGAVLTGTLNPGGAASLLGVRSANRKCRDSAEKEPGVATTGDGATDGCDAAAAVAAATGDTSQDGRRGAADAIPRGASNTASYPSSRAPDRMPPMLEL